MALRQRGRQRPQHRDRARGVHEHVLLDDDAMYRSSAQLSAYLAIKYLIPIDRKHFIGHNEVPDPNHPGQFGGFAHHTDPGRCWDWPKYMSLIKDFAAASVGTSVQRLGDDSARTFARPSGWSRAASPAAYARSFSVTRPNPTGAPVRYTLAVPKTGSYALYAWWPAVPSRNSSVPIGIDTSAGRRSVRVDQRSGSGWRYLGSFPLTGGKSTAVTISPRTTTPGSIAADAVKIELLSPRPASGLEAQAAGWAATARGLSSTVDGGASWSPSRLRASSPPRSAESASPGRRDGSSSPPAAARAPWRSTRPPTAAALGRRRPFPCRRTWTSLQRPTSRPWGRSSSSGSVCSRTASG